jgi:origin recognition complex subunit 2
MVGEGGSSGTQAEADGGDAENGGGRGRFESHWDLGLSQLIAHLRVFLREVLVLRLGPNFSVSVCPRVTGDLSILDDEVLKILRPGWKNYVPAMVRAQTILFLARLKSVNNIYSFDLFHEREPFVQALRSEISSFRVYGRVMKRKLGSANSAGELESAPSGKRRLRFASATVRDEDADGHMNEDGDGSEGRSEGGSEGESERGGEGEYGEAENEVEDQYGDGDTIEVAEVATPTKRGRGRPPGSKKKVEPVEAITPTKRGRGRLPGSKKSTEPTEATTPTKRGRGRPPGSKNKVPNNNLEVVISQSPTKRPTITGVANDIFSTPSKKTREPESQQNGTPTIVRNADRSARRKSARTLIQRTITGGLSDDDEEDLLARRIWDEDEDEDESSSGEDNDEVRAGGDPSTIDVTTPTATPSKRPRGRPKGSVNRPKPTSPPPNLPPHERYFFQNQTKHAKHTSNNTLSSAPLLTSTTYQTLIASYSDPHLPEQTHLTNLHASSSFPQWWFELQEGFNICLYGWGSKRGLVNRFAEWIHEEKGGAVVVVNGYLSGCGIRDILGTVVDAVVGGEGGGGWKLGAQPAEMLEVVLALLTKYHKKSKSKSNPTPPPLLTLLIHSLDSPALRPPRTQSLLSTLSSHPALSLLSTTDHPTAPLLWPSPLRTTYNFLFHDTTTFAPYDHEIPDPVAAVEEVVFGKQNSRAAGRDGLGFLLKSLPGNARELWRAIVREVSQAADGPDPAGIPYRTLYRKAVEEFICKSELTFRTLLKEYPPPFFFFYTYILTY